MVAVVDGEIVGRRASDGITPGSPGFLSIEPWLATAGAHEISVVLDPDSVVSDVNRDNNVSTITLEVHDGDADVPGRPNFAVKGVRVARTEFQTGDRVSFVAEVENTGSSATPDAVVRFLVDRRPIGEVAVSPIPGGERAQIASPTWDVRGGPHEITAIADPLNAARESSERDNEASNTFNADPVAPEPEERLDLAVVGVSLGEPGERGVRTVRAQVCNTGTVPIPDALVRVTVEPRPKGDKKGTLTNGRGIDLLGSQTTGLVAPEGPVATGAGPKGGRANCTTRTFKWAPRAKGDYSITARALMFSFEEDVANNVASSTAHAAKVAKPAPTTKGVKKDQREITLANASLISARTQVRPQGAAPLFLVRVGSGSVDDHNTRYWPSTGNLATVRIGDGTLTVTATPALGGAPATVTFVNGLTPIVANDLSVQVLYDPTAVGAFFPCTPRTPDVPGRQLMGFGFRMPAGASSIPPGFTFEGVATVTEMGTAKTITLTPRIYVNGFHGGALGLVGTSYTDAPGVAPLEVEVEGVLVGRVCIATGADGVSGGGTLAPAIGNSTGENMLTIASHPRDRKLDLAWRSPHAVTVLDALEVAVTNPDPAKAFAVTGHGIHLPRVIDHLTVQSPVGDEPTTIDLATCAAPSADVVPDCGGDPIGQATIGFQQPPRTPNPTTQFSVTATGIPTAIHLGVGPTPHRTFQRAGEDTPAAYRLRGLHSTVDYQANGPLASALLTAHTVDRTGSTLDARVQLTGVPNQAYLTWRNDGPEPAFYADTGNGGLAYDLRSRRYVEPFAAAPAIESIDVQLGQNAPLPLPDPARTETRQAVITAVDSGTRDSLQITAHVEGLRYLARLGAEGVMPLPTNQPGHSGVMFVDTWVTSAAASRGVFINLNTSAGADRIAVRTSAAAAPSRVLYWGHQVTPFDRAHAPGSQLHQVFAGPDTVTGEAGTSAVASPVLSVCQNGDPAAGCPDGVKVDLTARSLNQRGRIRLTSTTPKAGAITVMDGNRLVDPHLSVSNGRPTADATGGFRTVDLDDLVLPPRVVFRYTDGDVRLTVDPAPERPGVSGRLFAAAVRQPPHELSDPSPVAAHLVLDPEGQVDQLWARVDGLLAFRSCMTGPERPQPCHRDFPMHESSTPNVAQLTLNRSIPTALKVMQYQLNGELRRIMEARIQRPAPDFGLDWAAEPGLGHVLYQGSERASDAEIFLLNEGVIRRPDRTDHVGNGALQLRIRELPTHALVYWTSSTPTTETNFLFPDRENGPRTERHTCNANWTIGTIGLSTSGGGLDVPFLSFINLDAFDDRVGRQRRWSNLQIGEYNGHNPGLQMQDQPGGNIVVLHPCEEPFARNLLDDPHAHFIVDASAGKITFHARKYKFATYSAVPEWDLAFFNPLEQDYPWRPDRGFAAWQQTADIYFCDFRGWVVATDDIPSVWEVGRNAREWGGPWNIVGHHVPLVGALARIQGVTDMTDCFPGLHIGAPLPPQREPDIPMWFATGS